ncbi:hypothetical protein ECTHROOPD_5430 [Escherichia coli ThroopD]|nr:hypothetical protein ECTHROOPD_5430 [Escherichia coli ThroopD]
MQEKRLPSHIFSEIVMVVFSGVNAKIIGRFSPFLMSAIGH